MSNPYRRAIHQAIAIQDLATHALKATASIQILAESLGEFSDEYAVCTNAKSKTQTIRSKAEFRAAAEDILIQAAQLNAVLCAAEKVYLQQERRTKSRQTAVVEEPTTHP